MGEIFIPSFRTNQPNRETSCGQGWSASLLVFAAFLFLIFSALQVLAQDRPAVANLVSQPASRVDLSATSYRGFARTERLSDDENLSLDFVDANHVLFTFNQKKLFKRLPDCPAEHEDRLVRAVVLEIPGGTIAADTVWYLHDHRRYLWPLGSGRFLLRRLNSLYVVDSALHETLLMNSPKELLWVTVTPDRKQIIVETRANEIRESPSASVTKDPDAKSTQPGQKDKPQFLIEFLDADTLVVHRAIKLSAKVNLEGTAAGYADFVRKGDLWLVRFGPSEGERKNIARVRSQTVPRVLYSGDNSLLIARCPTAGTDYSVTTFTVTGRRLWRQRWTRPRYFPAISGTEDNSRFAVSTLNIAVSSGPIGFDAEGDIIPDVAKDGLEQTVQVLETASGTAVLSVPVSPAVQSGQNVALSPDGRRLAVLRDSSLEIYELPQAPDEEKAKFSALKADVPGLYVQPSSQIDANSEAVPDASGESDAQGRLSEMPSASPAKTDVTKTAEELREPLTTIKVSTRAVVVDVVVTDAKGHSIRGLRQQDFQVIEDGKPQAIRSFREFNDAEGAPGPFAPAAAPVKLAANVFTNNAPSPDQRVVTMVLLDMLNTPIADQQHARQDLVKFLKTRTEKRQFALCTLSSDRTAYLRMIQGFTSDENALLAAASSRKGAPRAVPGQMADAGMSNSIENIKQLAQGDPTNSWQGLLHGIEEMKAQGQVNDTDARVEITVDALAQLARYLSGIPGRKNLVWLSGSFPTSIFAASASDQPESDNRSYANKIRQATNLLAEGQIAVYPVDVGTSSAGVNAADNIGIAPGRAPTQLAAGQLGDTLSAVEVFQQQSLQALGSAASGRDTMNQFAVETGGTAFFNSNAIEDAIATATEQGSSYYTLSYSPANRNFNGRFRQIKVALAQKGTRLHYRQGYFAEDSRVPMKDKDVARDIGTAAMQHGSPQSHQIHFAVRVVPVGGKSKAERAGKLQAASRKKPALPSPMEVQHYGIDYAVDSSDLLFLAQTGDVHHSALNFMIAAYADDGRQLSGVSSTWTGDLDPAAYKEVLNGGVHVHQEVDVPTEAVSLRLGLQDRVSNHLGTIELPLPVAAPPDVPRTVRHSLPEIERD